MITPIAKFRVMVNHKFITVYEYKYDEYKIQMASLCKNCEINKEDRECIVAFNKKPIFYPEYSTGAGNHMQISIISLLTMENVEDEVKSKLVNFHANLMYAIKSRYKGSDLIFIGMAKPYRSEKRDMPALAEWEERASGKSVLGGRQLAHKKDKVRRGKPKTIEKEDKKKDPNNKMDILLIDDETIRKINQIPGLYTKIEELKEKVDHHHISMDSSMTKRTSGIRNMLIKLQTSVENIESGKGMGNYNNDLFTKVNKDLKHGFDQVYDLVFDVKEMVTKKKRKWYFLWLF